MKNPQVKKTFLPQDIAVLAVIFAAGAACFLLGEGWGGLGVVILLCGAMMLPFYRHGYRLEDRKGLYRLHEISLPQDNKAEILAYLEGKLETLDLHSPQPGGALVEVYYRKDEDLRLARFFDYADFSQGIEYPLHEVTREQVSTLESFATDKK
jgi:hypothetical protein